MAIVNGKYVPEKAGEIVNGRYVPNTKGAGDYVVAQNLAPPTAVSTEETPAQANERILGSLGLDTVLTPKKKKVAAVPGVSAVQSELVNKLGE